MSVIPNKASFTFSCEVNTFSVSMRGIINRLLIIASNWLEDTKANCK